MEDYPWLNDIFRIRDRDSQRRQRLVAFAKESFVRYCRELLRDNILNHPNEVSQDNADVFYEGFRDANGRRVDESNEDPFYKKGVEAYEVQWGRENKENDDRYGNRGYKYGGKIKRRFGTF
jgi:hypothetical protein